MLGRIKTSKYSKMRGFVGKEESEKIDNCTVGNLCESVSILILWAELHFGQT